MINDYFHTFVNYRFFTYNESIYHLELWLPTTLLSRDSNTTGSYCSIFDKLKKYLIDVVKVIKSLIDNQTYISTNSMKCQARIWFIYKSLSSFV